MQFNMNLINGHFITLENNTDDINSITIDNGKIKSFKREVVQYEMSSICFNIGWCRPHSA